MQYCSVRGLLAAIALALPSQCCYAQANLSSAQILTDPYPYYFPKENAPASQLFAMPLCKGVKIEDATIDQLQSYLSSGKLTSVDLVVIRSRWLLCKYRS